MIQAEISQLADGIQSAISNTQYNGMNLLDGSAQNLNTASSPDGTGATVSINDMSSLAQAISNFNVTGQFNISDIDQAISQVSNERANLGAMSNRFDYTVSANTTTSLNLAGARSRVGDADIAAEAMATAESRRVNEMEIMMQQAQQQQAIQQNQILGAPGATGAGM